LSLLFSATHQASHHLSAEQATAIAVLLIAAVAGKSALLPFSAWLPRAMEGPTSSSAVYYGSLSIHAGCYLLLRAEPLLAQSLLAQVLAGLAGGFTVVYASIVGRAQSDIKSSLAYASLTQVGVIIVEISLGLVTVAFVHMVGHACFRLLQLLRAPNVLHDLHRLERFLGDDHEDDETHPANRRPSSPRRRLYLFALERGFLDALVARLAIRPMVQLAAGLDRVDRLLCGSRSVKEAQTELDGADD
jgi:NAD(P)H-quinone oxidoreductase subunit 5